MSPISARARAGRSVLVGAATLALAAGTSAAVAGTQGPAGPAVPAGHSSRAASPDYRRACPATQKPGVMSCMALVRTNVPQRTEAALAGKAPVGFGYGRSSLIRAYKLPSVHKVVNVAVIDAYNDPKAESDLATYRSAWGLPKCNTSTHAGCLTVANQKGAASPLPKKAGSTGWATEESLDVDMVSAICPSCHIFLVEASSPSTANLGTAVDSAVKVLKAHYVSNSYGGSQNKNDPALDTKYYKHPGSAIVASAGDSGYGVSYPAASRYVVAAGGTSLRKAAGSNRGWTETVWGSAFGVEGTGSGCSKYEAKPAWQTHSGCSHRIDNDVAAVANPNTGVAVYDSYDQGGWLEVGGTSASSPIIASVYALAHTITAGTYPASYLYKHSGHLYDVTSGANGSCTHAFLCHARKGYDGPTGLGTPHGLTAFTG